MPYIDIREIDETTPGSVMESTDVVFIPGFVDINQPSLNDVTGYVGIEQNRPYLFTNLNEFITLCGDSAPLFNADQEYPTAFAAEAKSTATNDVFIKEGSADPSYIMAKELLAAGLPVLYQRVNGNEKDSVTYKYSAVSKDISDDLVGKEADASSTYFYKESEDYLSYSDVVNYREFDSFKDPITKEIMVARIEEIETADAKNYYESTENTYHVVNGKIEVETDENKDYALFKDTFLVKEGDGAFVKFADKYDDEDMPEELPEGTYALAIMITAQPDDWRSNYTSYFKKGAETVESRTRDTYRVIEKLSGSAYKTYVSGNIYSRSEEVSSACSVEKMYEALDNIFTIAEKLEDQNVSGLMDKGNFSVKYLTSGGYPVFEYTGLTNKMLTLAETRGDCVALIDHTDYIGRELNPYKAASLYQAVKAEKGTSLEKGEFGAMFTPWATYSRITSDENIDVTTFRAPGSFAYLMALADSIKTNANWLAVAGAARGGVKNLHEMTTIIPNGVADAMQPRNDIAVNAITDIKPYGYTIWGNRTLKDNSKQGNLVATSFLNIRNLVSDVKKTCYRTARKLTFEQDTDILWINFKAEISKLLNQMKSGYGISGYKIIRDTTHARAKDKATICAKVILYPTYAVEDFYITIVLKDDEVTVE